MGSLDPWLIWHAEEKAVDKRIECPIWGRVASVVRHFSTFRVVDSALCKYDDGGFWMVEVFGRFTRGVSVRLLFRYFPEYGASVPRRKVRKPNISGGLPQAVADILFDLAARFHVEIDGGGHIYIEGIEIDISRCLRRNSVDYGCVLRQLAKGEGRLVGV